MVWDCRVDGFDMLQQLSRGGGQGDGDQGSIIKVWSQVGWAWCAVLLWGNLCMRL